MGLTDTAQLLVLEDIRLEQRRTNALLEAALTARGIPPPPEEPRLGLRRRRS